ncbi:hypothetical protein ACLMJK_001338 [Lecanora helva]
MQLRTHAFVAASVIFIICITSLRLGLRSRVSSNPTYSLLSSFGVGLDLSASYGSAAMSFPNGTINTIATISAKEEYKEVMKRLSLDSSRHLSPPYNSPGESWDDMARQYKRKARKAIGLPASTDVGHLAKMLIDLRAAVEDQVGPITKAGVTTMHLVALYDEDLHDAFEYVGLEYVTFPIGDVGHNILYETSAAYAGYGYGLCSDYKDDPEACKNEQYNMTQETVMAVVYTDTVLSVSLSEIKSAYALWEPSYRYLADFDLGYQESLSRGKKDYWDSVNLKLQEIMIQNPYYDRPSRVILMGDRINDPVFWDTLVSALKEQMGEEAELPMMLSDGSQKAAARGVAEMTKRALLLQNEIYIIQLSHAADL